MFYMGEVQDTKAVPEWTMAISGDEKNCMEVLRAITKEIKPEVPAAAGWSSTAVHPRPPTVPKEKEVLDSRGAVAHVELCADTRTAFDTIFDTIKDECRV